MKRATGITEDGRKEPQESLASHCPLTRDAGSIRPCVCGRGGVWVEGGGTMPAESKGTPIIIKNQQKKKTEEEKTITLEEQWSKRGSRAGDTVLDKQGEDQEQPQALRADGEGMEVGGGCGGGGGGAHYGQTRKEQGQSGEG